MTRPNEKTNSKSKTGRKRPTRSLAAKKKTQKKSDPGKAQNQFQNWQAGQVIPSGINTIHKYKDIGNVPDGGRQLEYWENAEVIPLFPKLRKAKSALPKSFAFYDHAYLMNHFGLRGWEFGKWVTNEDRMNYVCGSGIALFDLRAVLGFPAAQIGLEGMVSMAIGARGKSRAVAHFEPNSFAINLTRYKDNPGPSELHSYPFLKIYPKTVRFLNMGGVGSLAHEYGHALDYFFGGYIDQDPDAFALSGGSSVRTAPDMALLQRKGMRATMEKVLNQIIWEKPGKQTAFYSNLRAYLTKNKIKSDYLYRRNELFARVFEQYIGFKLKQKGIVNALLHKRKYGNISYLPEAHLKTLVPAMDRLVSLMKSHLKKV